VVHLGFDWRLYSTNSKPTLMDSRLRGNDEIMGLSAELQCRSLNTSGFFSAKRVSASCIPAKRGGLGAGYSAFDCAYGAQALWVLAS